MQNIISSHLVTEVSGWFCTVKDMISSFKIVVFLILIALEIMFKFFSCFNIRISVYVPFILHFPTSHLTEKLPIGPTSHYN